MTCPFLILLPNLLLLLLSPGVAQFGVVKPSRGKQASMSELVSLSFTVQQVLIRADTTHSSCGAKKDSLHLID
jgi:hypothetical protein